MSNQDLYTAMRIIENAVGGNKRESQADKLLPSPTARTWNYSIAHLENPTRPCL